MHKTIVFVLHLLFAQALMAQHFSGSWQSNLNVFLKDERIGAANIPQYEDEIFGAEQWLELQYSKGKLSAAARIDAFLHSNLLNPSDSYSDWGLGKLNLSYKTKHGLIEIGSVYDQIGSGIIFRAYEERPLLIDNALVGGHIEINLPAHFQLDVFGGRQKNLFDFYSSDIIAAEVNTAFSIGKSSWLPGVGIIRRSFSDDQIDQLIATVQVYEEPDRVDLFKHTYAYTVYNNFDWGVFNWNAEFAFQRYGVLFDPNATRVSGASELLGAFVQRDGSVLYNSFSLAFSNFSAAFEWKRTENFDFRADPFATLNRGLINFLPPMSRINSFRLKSRYVPATQFLGEQAYQLDLNLRISKKWRFNQYFSFIEDLDGNGLYKEVDNEFYFKNKSKFQLKFGLQWQSYNQGIYEGKGAVPDVKTVIPYFEVVKRLQKKRTIRFEGQYLKTDQDLGSWWFGLVEYSIAPHWSFSVSDMYNVKPAKGADDIHYPRVDVYYTKGASRFGLSFVKQVEGIVCAGGICRLEPAFSGIRGTITTNF